MRADFVPPLVDDDTAALHVGLLPRHEARVVTVGNKADLLAVGLLGNLQPKTPRGVTHRVLVHVSNRKERAGELLLRQREEKV
jgi:hypothetical protein